ncbi:MAG: hypothetical protein NZ700_15660 [Gemmataceae bacterium]|nr:hypothetical protein [Gemmataceae bacterium]MDW8264018.1 hypothetical protein [Gemmataceae bacterium]
MKRLVVGLLVIGLVVAGLTVAEAEEPHLDFVRGLREKGYADLALEYLQLLGQKASKEIAQVLPLEIAKTRLALAVQESSQAARNALYAQVRAELDKFIKDNPKHPLVSSANLEIARVVSMQGKALLSRAKRQDSLVGRQNDAEAARAMFAEAAGRLQAAAQQIGTQLATAEGATKAALEKAKLQADFDLAINWLDQAETFMGDAEALKRAEAVDKALKLFRDVADRDARNPLCWQARAWAGRCYIEIQNPDEARKEFALVEEEKSDAADAGKRLVGWFRLMLPPDPGDKKPLATLQTQAENWLKRYAAYANTPEGYGVRFKLAEVYTSQAQAIPMLGPMKDIPQQAALDLYARAERIYKALQDSDNEYAQEARIKRLNIILVSSAQRSRGDIAKLKNFDECYVRAQYEAAVMESEEKKVNSFAAKLPPDPLPADREKLAAMQKKLAEDRKKHLQSIIEALNRALQLADAKVPKQDLIDARYMLAYVYLTVNDPYRAAVVAEHLGRSELKSPRAGGALGTAIAAYAQLIAKAEARLEAEKANNVKSPLIPVLQQDIASDRERLRQTAVFMEKHLPDDPTTDFARHQLAGLLLRERKPKEAIEVLRRVTPGYNYIAQARFQEFQAIQELQREHENNKTLTPELRQAFQKQAMQVLASIPDTVEGSDPDITNVYIMAKLQLGQMLYEAGKFDEIEAMVDKLAKKLPTMRMTQKAREDLVPRVAAIGLYARYGKAKAQLAAGDFAKVIQTTAPAVEDLKRRQPGEDKYASLRRAVVVLAIRAYVQEGKTDEALRLLELLQQAAADDQESGGAATIFLQVIQELKNQIEELQQKGNAGEEQLAKAKASILAFLNSVSKAKNLAPDTVLYLANSYANLGQSDQAAALLDRIEPPPKEAPKPPLPLTAAEQADPKKVQEHEQKTEEYRNLLQEHQRKITLYNTARIMRVRALRLGARELEGEKRQEALKKAFQLMKDMFAEKEKGEKEGWASRSLDAQRERLLLLEDMELYGGSDGAILGWNDLMKRLNPQNNPKNEEPYFDCYYHLTYCFYKNALKMPDGPKKVDAIKRAAGFIVKLETNKPNLGSDVLKQRYIDLLRKEAPLREQYLAQGGKLLSGLEEPAKVSQ